MGLCESERDAADPSCAFHGSLILKGKKKGIEKESIYSFLSYSLFYFNETKCIEDRVWCRSYFSLFLEGSINPF